MVENCANKIPPKRAINKKRDVNDLLRIDYKKKLKSVLGRFENVDAAKLLQSLYLRNDNAGEILNDLDKINEIQLNKALLIQDKIIRQIVDCKPDIDIENISNEAEDDSELNDAVTELKDKDSLDFQKLLNLVVFFLRDKHIGNIKKLITNVEREQYDLKALARIGEFTGLIAHIVRNPLANILITSELLKSKLGEDDPRNVHVDTIISEIGKLETKIEDLVNYKDIKETKEIHSEEIDIHEIMSMVLADLQRKLKDHHINVFTSFAADIPKVHLQATKIEEAFINILQNIIDAMPNGGEVNISTYVKNRRISDKGSIVIVMEDTGDGIKPEHIDRIFQPCFTTKKDGMGLGLYMTKKFINDHNGNITVENKVEKGARFTIALPIKNGVKKLKKITIE